MQDLTVQHANTFFFFTTIAVAILIGILLVLLYVAYIVFRFVRRTTAKVDTMLDTAAAHTEVSPVYKKTLAYTLPVLGYFFKRKIASSRQHKTVKHNK